ncbi:MAG TPA: metalloregulator ArsR/SmtB family transcription factor [Candidatus Limnocylindrales bacterium]|jgi:DNA-binding transcriptional ArsR family regulator
MQTDPLSATFSALADPTRRAILARLANGEATVTELAEPFQMSLPGVSKHLKVLETAGLVVKGRDAQWRPCRLEGKPLRDVAAWMETYRRFWDESFDRLDDYLQELQTKEKPDDRRH